MTEVQITNGSVKYGETRKTGDFENKRADVELTFNIGEKQNADEVVLEVSKKAKAYLEEILSGNKPKNLTPMAPRMPKPPETPAQASQSEAQTANLNKQVTTVLPVVAVGGDLSTVQEPTPFQIAQKSVENKQALVIEKIKLASEIINANEITDAQLMDATTKCQQHVKNAPAIRKLLNELGVKAPPGRLIDLPQDKRQPYLEGLSKIKPLA